MLAREAEIVTAALKCLDWNFALAPHCSEYWASYLPVLSLTAARVLKVQLKKESHYIQNLLYSCFRDGKAFFSLSHCSFAATGEAEDNKSGRRTVLALLRGQGRET